MVWAYRVTPAGIINFQLRFRLKSEIDKGNDPRIVKQLEKIANLEVIIVNDLFDMWFDAYCSRHYKHLNEAKRNFTKHIAPALGDLPFDKISIHQWYSHFEKLARKYSTTTKSCFTICTSMAQWGTKRKLIEANPLLEIRVSSDLKVKNNKVERILSDEEIWLLYRYLEESEMKQSNKVSFQLLLHFGCRGGELRFAKQKISTLKATNILIAKRFKKRINKK